MLQGLCHIIGHGRGLTSAVCLLNPWGLTGRDLWGHVSNLSPGPGFTGGEGILVANGSLKFKPVPFSGSHFELVRLLGRLEPCPFLPLLWREKPPLWPVVNLL